jgi:uncharacterized SAM-binding protein YcdF (DUF218 family)
MITDLISGRRRLLTTHLLIALILVVSVQLLIKDRNQFANLLVQLLEDRFRRPDVTTFDKVTGIIVLTGRNNRLVEAGRLARDYPRLPIVISGAGDMTDVVAELGGGIDPSRVNVETRANNTYENALYSAEMIKPKKSERWLLVTGASHMPRAMGSFRRAGFEVEPWPVYDLIASDSDLIDVARHEWLGLFAYWAFGRTSALLPG